MAKKATSEAAAKDPKPKRLKLVHAPWHGIVYCDPMGGKSTMLATLAKEDGPICVWCFDGRGKDMPYWKVGRPQRVGETKLPKDEWGTPYREVWYPERDEVMVRIEYYQDPIIESPEAYSRFIDRLSHAQKELHLYRGFVLDSVTSTSLLGRKWSQYELQDTAKDPRKWYAEATDLLEEVLMAQLPAMPCHVGVACHIARTKVEAEGTMVRTPLAPGRLAAAMASQWPEMYRIYVDHDKGGNKRRYLQTDSDEKWQAGTQMGLPDPCKPTFKAIWAEGRGAVEGG